MFGEKKEEEKKEGLGIKDWVELVGVMVAILVAVTSLLSRSGYVPSWWFPFSLIFLIILVFSVPVVVFRKPVSERVGRFEQTRRENSIAREHFKEFEGLVDRLAGVLFPFSELWNMTKQYYVTQHSRPIGVEMFPAHLIESVQSEWGRSYNKFYEFSQRCKGFSGSKRDLSLLLNEFNRFLEDAQSQVRILTVCATEMRLSTTNPEIMKKYEEFREQYNIFINDYMKYCHRLNVEFGQNTFREDFENIKKW